LKFQDLTPSALILTVAFVPELENCRMRLLVVAIDIPCDILKALLAITLLLSDTPRTPTRLSRTEELTPNCPILLLLLLILIPKETPCALLLLIILLDETSNQPVRLSSVARDYPRRRMRESNSELLVPNKPILESNTCDDTPNKVIDVVLLLAKVAKELPDEFFSDTCSSRSAYVIPEISVKSLRLLPETLLVFHIPFITIMM
jgi:hypothetical protein